MVRLQDATSEASSLNTALKVAEVSVPCCPGCERITRIEVLMHATRQQRRMALMESRAEAVKRERDILSAEAGSHTHTLRTRGVRTSHAHKPLRQANCLDTAAACRPTPRARTVPPSAPILRVPNIRGQSYTSSGVARRARRRA